MVVHARKTCFKLLLRTPVGIRTLIRWRPADAPSSEVQCVRRF